MDEKENDSDLIRKRKKTWEEKSQEVINSLERASKVDIFPRVFYRNLFFLNPELEKRFEQTDWNKQEIALLKGVEHIAGFFEKKDQIHHQNVLRLAESHSKKNLDIHPHHYYYWIDAMIMTLKAVDHLWYDDMEYYTRECLFFPISFMISLYHK